MNFETMHKYFRCPAPEDIPTEVFVQVEYKNLHNYAISHMGYSVITQRNCRILADLIQHRPVLEIMCGLGSYAYTLRGLGVPVIATDDFSWIDDDPKFVDWKLSPWINDIERLEAISAIQKYGSVVDYVLMSWPPMNENYAAQALETMRMVNENCRMIYVGEERCGVTANDIFFEMLSDVSSQYSNIDVLRKSYHSWINNGFHDKQYIIK